MCIEYFFCLLCNYSISGLHPVVAQSTDSLQMPCNMQTYQVETNIGFFLRGGHSQYIQYYYILYVFIYSCIINLLTVYNFTTDSTVGMRKGY